MRLGDSTPQLRAASTSASRRVGERRVTTIFDLNLAYYILIAALAVWLSPPMQTPLFGLQIAQLKNIIPVAAVGVFIASLGKNQRLGKAERKALAIFAAYMALFSLSFARSTSHFLQFQRVDPEDFGGISGVVPTLVTYIDSYFAVPFLCALSFVYVVCRMRTEEQLLALFRAISIGVATVSLVLIFAIAANPDVLLSSNRSQMVALCSALFNLHYNNVGTIYIITGPLLLYLATTRGKIWRLNFALAAVAVLLLESRTTFAVFGLMNVITYYVIARRSTFNVVVILISAAAVAFALIFSGSQTIEGYFTGFQVQNTSALNGRESLIWAPLLDEWWQSGVRFWFGNGEYAILTSQSRLTGSILNVAQAHSAYLEFFLDQGLLVFLGFFATLAFLLVRGIKFGMAAQSGLYWSLLLCVVSFLIGGLTGRQFLPQAESLLIFPVLGALVVVAAVHKRRLRLRNGISGNGVAVSVWRQGLLAK